MSRTHRLALFIAFGPLLWFCCFAVARDAYHSTGKLWLAEHDTQPVSLFVVADPCGLDWICTLERAEHIRKGS